MPVTGSARGFRLLVGSQEPPQRRVVTEHGRILAGRELPVQMEGIGELVVAWPVHFGECEGYHAAKAAEKERAKR